MAGKRTPTLLLTTDIDGIESCTETPKEAKAREVQEMLEKGLRHTMGLSKTWSTQYPASGFRESLVGLVLLSQPELHGCIRRTLGSWAT